VTIVNTRKEVTQLRIEGSNTEDEAKIPFATIVLIPHAILLSLGIYMGGMVDGGTELTHCGEENKKL
jgi:hypothetical protein